MTENHKLVVCDVRCGSLNEPKLDGVEWVEIPGTRQTAGAYSQAGYAARVPESMCDNLPEHCSVQQGYEHVTKLNVTVHYGEDVLEVCFQEAEGHPIKTEIW